MAGVTVGVVRARISGLSPFTHITPIRDYVVYAVRVVGELLMTLHTGVWCVVCGTGLFENPSQRGHGTRASSSLFRKHRPLFFFRRTSPRSLRHCRPFSIFDQQHISTYTCFKLALTCFFVCSLVLFFVSLTNVTADLAC